MRVLAISHQRDAGAGVFAEAAVAARASLDEWFIAETPRPPADPFAYDAVISFGGAMHPDQEREHAWIADEKALLRDLLGREMPLLGVCLGSQLLAEAAGGTARRASTPEIGWHGVEVTEQGSADPVLAELAPGFDAFQWHTYECVAPAEATILARSAASVQAFRVGERAYGIQFHAEVSAADVRYWIDTYGADPDAKRFGIDPEALGVQTLPRMDAWNELGRGLCRRFLAAADRRPRSTSS